MRPGRWATDGWRWFVERIELRTLIVLGAVAGCLWVFIAIAEEVMEGETHVFDKTLLLALRNPANLADPLGPAWLEELARDVTAFGGVGILAAITLTVAGFLWLQGRKRSMWVVLASVGSGQVLSSLAKLGFDRPRPDLVPHGMVTYTTSFPSGHSMMSAVTYLTLAVMLARMQPTAALRTYVVAVAIVLVVAIGVSRVYLGVHWPTDVLAGWTAGAGWALACWLAANWAETRAKGNRQ